MGDVTWNQSAWQGLAGFALRSHLTFMGPEERAKRLLREHAYRARRARLTIALARVGATVEDAERIADEYLYGVTGERDRYDRY